MTIFPLAVLATIASVLAVPAMAVHQEKNVQPAPEKKLCRSVKTIGSFIPERTCHTSAEWKALDQAGSENARIMLEKSLRRSSDGQQE